MRLQDLIKARKAELGLTYQQMVDRSTEAGYPLSRSLFHHLAENEWPNVPPTETIRGIAAAIEVDADEVLNAAAESVGLGAREVQIDRGTRATLAMLTDRSNEQQALLREVIRSVIAAMDARDQPDEPTKSD